MDNTSEVSNSLFMVVNHLISFSTLVQVSDVGGVPLNTLGVGEDWLLEFLHAAVRQPNMIVNIRLNRNERMVFQSFFELFDALFVFLVGVVSQA